MRRLTSDRQSGASCDELQEKSLLLSVEAAQHLKQEPNCTAGEKLDEKQVKRGSWEKSFTDTYSAWCKE